MISTDVFIETQFYDLDPMQVVWHGNYPRFLEQARCALLDKVAFSYREMSATNYTWPVVDLHIKYVRPIRLSQRLKVTATLVEYQNRVRIRYRISDAVTGEVLTKAQTTQVAVDQRTNEICFESPLELQESVRRCL